MLVKPLAPNPSLINTCLAREGKKPLGSFSHFPATARTTTSSRCAPRGRRFHARRTVLVQDAPESSKASNTGRQKTDGPVLSPHSPRIAPIEQGPVALSASFHGTRGFFSHSAPLLRFSNIQPGSAPTWNYTVFITELRKRSTQTDLYLRHDSSLVIHQLNSP